jgi:hypothetical protein
VDAVIGPPFIAVDANLGFVADRFGFSIIGQEDQSVVVETSTNLHHWVAIQTNSLGNGSSSFVDPDPIRRPQRFYRLRLQP